MHTFNSTHIFAASAGTSSRLQNLLDWCVSFGTGWSRALLAGDPPFHLAMADISLSDSRLDSDNGSEFINWHLKGWCEQNHIQLTRGRPYKKDDNAHIEQKNWTHVRKLLGWERYASQAAVEAINDLYRGELRLWLNLYLPSVKLVKKVRWDRRYGAFTIRRKHPSSECWQASG